VPIAGNQIAFSRPSFRLVARSNYPRAFVALEYQPMTDLQAKAEKYETKAAQCQESVRQAKNGSQRGFYEALAQYYAGLATDYRHVIEKRKTA
jgi:hypothetical protein